LRKWALDVSVRVVVLSGAGDRGLCAGGDIVEIHRDALSGIPPLQTVSATFWREEYDLNLAISRYPKPYVALMSGLVLGGGVGLSAHGRHRIVTDASQVGMPETGIGFVPDVGGTWLLSQAPGEIGTYLALTAARVGPGDAITADLADHYVPRAVLEGVVEEVAKVGLDQAREHIAQEPPEGLLARDLPWINTCFKHDDPVAIIEALRQVDEPRAAAAADKILSNAPLAVAATLTALRRAREMSGLAEALDMEHRLICNFMGLPDMAEGIRAAVIDKDRRPCWSPAALSEITPAQVAALFAETATKEIK
jgi:enoyl-CoA hydratase